MRSCCTQEFVHPFWETRRPKLVPTLHHFPRPEFNPWRYPLAEDTPLFKIWTMAKSFKFWVLSSLLQLFGQKQLAQRLWSGWKVGMTLIPYLEMRYTSRRYTRKHLYYISML